MVRGVGLEPTQAYANRSYSGLGDFAKFCQIDLRLKEKTVYSHMRLTKQFLHWINKAPDQVTREDIRNYLAENNNKDPAIYKNTLSALKRFFRDYMDKKDLVNSFKFPAHKTSVIRVPTKEEITKFYAHLEKPIEKALFLMYASTGLRRNEILDLKLSEINFEKRMVIPNKEANETKNTWITFFNIETEKVLKEYLKTRTNLTQNSKLFPIAPKTTNKKFAAVKQQTGINITPQKLREWFCSEMGRLGVPDRYVDAFCGRVPKSILARHYTDFNPERLKEIYDRADLKVLA